MSERRELKSTSQGESSHTKLTRTAGQHGSVTVEVWDSRQFPDYKATPIIALIRNALNETGANWLDCKAFADKIQEAIKDADYLIDDVGRTWALSFVPFKERET